MSVSGGTVSWSLLPETTPGSHCGDLEYTYINEYGRIISVKPCQICLVKKDLAQREKVYQKKGESFTGDSCKT